MSHEDYVQIFNKYKVSVLAILNKFVNVHLPGKAVARIPKQQTGEEFVGRWEIVEANLINPPITSMYKVNPFELRDASSNGGKLYGYDIGKWYIATRIESETWFSTNQVFQLCQSLNISIGIPIDVFIMWPTRQFDAGHYIVEKSIKVIHRG